MNIALPLEEMSLSEKLHVMEEIWVDLSRTSSGFTPPEWHGDILAERKKQFDAGEIGSKDWEEAKRIIQEQTR